jgi:hypothetical protein
MTPTTPTPAPLTRQQRAAFKAWDPIRAGSSQCRRLQSVADDSCEPAPGEAQRRRPASLGDEARQARRCLPSALMLGTLVCFLRLLLGGYIG